MSEKQKFSCGVWMPAAREGDDWESVIYLDGSPHLEICQCFHRSRSEVGKEECEANVYLISAAPIGYELAETVIRRMSDLSYLTDGDKEILNKAREFMRVAKGE